MRPHLYKSATSPDGSWSVTVVRQRVRPPRLEGVDVVVRVADADGTIMFEETIDQRDLWEDVDDRYPDVICENDEIRIGPGWYDGEKKTYFVLKKEDLE